MHGRIKKVQATRKFHYVVWDKGQIKISNIERGKGHNTPQQAKAFIEFYLNRKIKWEN